MDFLFAAMPATNFQMTENQLKLWQRNAVFECECDNFINRRIEAGRSRQVGLPNHRSTVLDNYQVTAHRMSYGQIQASVSLGRPILEQSAIDAAIQQHGLHSRDESNETDNNNAAEPPPAQRARVDNHRDLIDRFCQEAIAVTMRLLQQHP